MWGCVAWRAVLCRGRQPVIMVNILPPAGDEGCSSHTTHRDDLLQVILLCDVFVAHSNLQFSMKVCQLSMQLVWVDLKATRLMWAATCTIQNESEISYGSQ